MSNKYLLIAIGLSVITCIPWFVMYERKKASVTEAVLVAVMVAFSTVGRIAFAAFPHFKPVTALVTVAGASLGPGAGFVTGALTAAVSNMYYGHGPWTVFQMAGWGIIGMVSGIFGEHIRSSSLRLAAFGAMGGVAFSMIMDVYTLLSTDEVFNGGRLMFYAAAGLPVTLIHAVSSAVFLLILGRPFCRKLSRIKRKYID